MLTRTLATTIRRACRTFPAVWVAGPRQSGKTTLLRMGWEKTHSFVSLENPDVRARATADPNGFLRDHPAPVILDEIQYTPDLLPYIKSAIDEVRKPGQWLLSGSQQFPLMQGISQSLAGRVAVTTLLPFSIGEAAGHPGGRRTLDSLIEATFFRSVRNPAPGIDLGHWLIRGAYPEPRANRAVDRNLWCASYIQTYLERDVRQLVAVNDLNVFERFLRLTAARTAQLLNYSDLARDVGVSPPTVRSWISLLEASGQVYLLMPYHRDFGKRLVKSPKLYFLDSALAAFLVGLHDPVPLLQGPFAGAFMETAVVAAWVKAFHHRGEPPALYFWRSGDGLEVDLLIDRNGVLYPLEIKASSTPTPEHAAGIQKWRRLAGTEDTPGAVVANVDRACALCPGVRAVPWWVV